jgi:hypothetical protein
VAQFNPGVPDTNDPNYLSYSRPISTPESDKSAVYAGQAKEFEGKKSQYLGEAKQYEGKAEAYEGQAYEALFKGLGDIFTSSVKTADNIIKSQIDSEIYSSVDAQRTTYTKQLEEMGKGPAPQVNPQPELLADEFSGQSRKASTPREIEEGIDNARSMVSARENGKMTQTEYIRNVNMLATRLRTQYSGHRDYIDTKMAEVTGMNPANAYIKSMINDINATQAALQSGKNKIESVLLKAVDEVPGFQNYYLAWKAGNISDEQALTKLNQAQSWKYDLQKKEAQLKDRKGTLEENRINDSQSLSDIAGQRINMFLGGIETRIPADMRERIAKGEPVDPAAAQAVARGLTAQYNALYQSLYRDGVRLGMHKSNSLGADNLSKEIHLQLAPVKEYIKALDSGDTSAAVAISRQNSAIVDSSQNRMLNSPDALGVAVRAGAAAKQAGGDVLVGKITAGVLDKGLTSGTEAWLERELKIMAGKPANPTDPNALPDTRTPKQIIDTAKKAKVANPRINQVLVDQIDHISDPKIGDDAKINLIRSFTDPANANFVSEFSKDRWNTPDGLYKNGAKWIKGRYETFSKLTSPKTVESIKRLAEQKDPALFKQYTDYIQTSFSKELFSRELRDLNTIQETKGLKLTWHTEEKQFYMNYEPNAKGKGGNLDPMEAQQRYQFYKPGLDRLNTAIQGMSNVARAAGQDVDTYLFKLFRDNGVTHDGKQAGLPSAMMTAMYTGNQGARALNFAPDQLPSSGNVGPFARVGSVDSFLAPSSGSVAPARNNAPASPGRAPRGNLTDTDVISIGRTGDTEDAFSRINPNYGR